MVAVPVGEEGLVDGGFFLGQHGLQPCSPGGFAFACVD